MKHTLKSWVRTAAIVAGVGFTTFANAQLLNGGFENGTGSSATSWFQFGNSYREASGANSGSYSMKMFGNFSGGFNVTGAFQDFAISAGQSASASCYALNASFDPMSGGNWALMKLIYRDAANNDLVSVESAQINAGTVQDQEQLLTASLGAAPVGTDHGSLFLLFLQPEFAGGSTFFDDASVNVVPEPVSLFAVGTGLVALLRKRRR